MLETLKFVKGAVAKKDLLPALTHFKIENGTIRSFNGVIALASPIELDIDCVPKAIPFVKAIENCNETVSLSLTPAKRLGIKSGKFKAFIECVEDEATPHVEPEGEFFDIDGAALLKALKIMRVIVGDDASRPWTNGVLLNGQSAYATNNVILTQYWIGSHFPIIANVPRAAIQELLRINKAPIKAQATASSLTFHFEEDRWLRTCLLSTDWPDVDKIIESDGAPLPIAEEFFEALNVIKPFADDMGRVRFTDTGVTTSPIEGEGASFEIPNLHPEGIYQIEMLQKLDGLATSIDFTKYPDKVPFFGDMVRGVIIGMR